MGRHDYVKELKLDARRDTHDNWENVKGDIESALSDILGQTWNVDVEYNQVLGHAVAYNQYDAKKRPGTIIAGYFQAAMDRPESHIDRNGVSAKEEINYVCTAHVLILQCCQKRDLLCNGWPVTSEGKLAIFFDTGKSKIAINIGDCLEQGRLTKGPQVSGLGV